MAAKLKIINETTKKKAKFFISPSLFVVIVTVCS
jgi:hypothetical protein